MVKNKQIKKLKVFKKHFSRKKYKKKKIEKIKNDDQCFKPPGFPQKLVGRIEELKICGKGRYIDTSCDRPNCNCILKNVRSKKAPYDKIIDFQEKYEDRDYQSTRLNTLSAALRYPNQLDDVIVVMFLNSDSIFLFQNWLYSCNRYEIDPKKMLLVVAEDKKSETFLSIVKINYISARDMYLKGTKLLSVAKAKENFISALDINLQETKLQTGYQAKVKAEMSKYKILTVVGLAVLTDIIKLGISVIYQDVDVIWRKDPREYLVAGSENSDIQLIFDPNGTNTKNQGSLGFVFVLSNCRTKIFMETMMHHIWLSEHFDHSDQTLWNALIRSQSFRLLPFTTLPEKLFINGYQFYDGYSKYHIENILTENYYVIHVNWCNSWTEKRDKLKKIGHWYLGDYSIDKLKLQAQDVSTTDLSDY